MRSCQHGFGIEACASSHQQTALINSIRAYLAEFPSLREALSNGRRMTWPMADAEFDRYRGVADSREPSADLWVHGLSLSSRLRLIDAFTSAPINMAISPKLDPVNAPTKLALPCGRLANQFQKLVHIHLYPTYSPQSYHPILLDGCLRKAATNSATNECGNG